MSDDIGDPNASPHAALTRALREAVEAGEHANHAGVWIAKALELQRSSMRERLHAFALKQRLLKREQGIAPCCEALLMRLDRELETGEIDASHDEVRLAAAAPALVRVLLAVEWSGKDDRWQWRFCPVCGGYDPDDAHMRRGSGHTADCMLDVALRKAGVR